METLFDVSVAVQRMVLTPSGSEDVALFVIVTAKMSAAVAVPIDTVLLELVILFGTVITGAVLSLIVML